jgi:hypothetical protein
VPVSLKYTHSDLSSTGWDSGIVSSTGWAEKLTEIQKNPFAIYLMDFRRGYLGEGIDEVIVSEFFRFFNFILQILTGKPTLIKPAAAWYNLTFSCATSFRRLSSILITRLSKSGHCVGKSARTGHWRKNLHISLPLSLTNPSSMRGLTRKILRISLSRKPSITLLVITR